MNKFNNETVGHKIIWNILKKYKYLIWKLKEIFLWNYYYQYIRDPKIKSSVINNTNIINDIVEELKKNNFEIKEYNININEYNEYVTNANYHIYKKYYKRRKAKNFKEKLLEHFIAGKILKLSKKDVYIDIASARSPTPEIYNKLYRCKVYRQDASFPEGLNNNTIGGNAANLPVENNFASKMALHCSFEHFEQDSDIKFITEAGRVLKKGGKLCILPLYLFNQYAIQTDPLTLPKGGIEFENDATIYCAKGWKNRHGRFYDVPHLISRIKNNLGDLKLTIYIVQNEKEIDKSCYLKFIALFEKS